MSYFICLISEIKTDRKKQYKTANFLQKTKKWWK